ncbi:MAG: glutaredoxin domain-containing protein [Thermoleophilia bacterium]
MRDPAPDSPLPVVVYTLPGCVHCLRARRTLERRGLPYDEVSGVGDPAFRARLVALTGRATVPQITIDGEPIGGADELAHLDRRGVLVPRVHGAAFPQAVVRRRLAPAGVVRWLLSGGRRPATRWRVSLVDEHGRVLGRLDFAARDDAVAHAAAHGGGPAAQPGPARP